MATAFFGRHPMSAAAEFDFASLPIGSDAEISLALY